MSNLFNLDPSLRPTQGGSVGHRSGGWRSGAGRSGGRRSGGRRAVMCAGASIRGLVASANKYSVVGSNRDNQVRVEARS